MSEYRRYRRQPRQSTKALTAKIAMLASVATLAIGGLIAAQMAAGSDPSLGPKAASRANKSLDLQILERLLQRLSVRFKRLLLGFGRLLLRLERLLVLSAPGDQQHFLRRVTEQEEAIRGIGVAPISRCAARGGGAAEASP